MKEFVRMFTLVVASCWSVPAVAIETDHEPRREAPQLKGVAYAVVSTLYVQGATSGKDPKGVRLGSKLDLFLTFDGKELVGWKGGGLKAHLEYRTGRHSAGQAGTLIPSNLAMYAPEGTENVIFLSSLHLTQQFDKDLLMLGKINVIDLTVGGPFMGFRGTEGFMNTEFVTPVNGVLNPVWIGAVYMMPGTPTWTLMAFDPEDRGDVGPSGLFRTGFGASVAATVPVALGRLRGRQTLSAAYNSQEAIDLDSLGQITEPPTNGRPIVGTKRGTYFVAYALDLFVAPTYGVFGKLTVTDGNPNIQESSFQLGLSGKGLLKGRPDDRFGVGFYQFNVSNSLRRALRGFGIATNRAERGVEAFYSFAVDPNLSLTADIQWIAPGLAGTPSAFFPGFRARYRF